MKVARHGLCAFVLLLVTGGAVGGTVVFAGDTLQPTRPYAAWALDEGSGDEAEDRYGERDGQLEGTGTDQGWHTGAVFSYVGAGCLELSGSGQQVVLSENAGILLGKASCTVSAWFYWTDALTSKQSTIYSERDECQYNVFFLGVENRIAATKGLQFAVFERAANGDCGVGPGWHTLTDPAGPPTPDAWHHAVGVLDAVSGMKLYLDGELVASNEDTAFYNASAGDVSLGHTHLSTYDSWWPGLLDEVAVWDRALSAEEVRWLFENSLVSLPPDPVSYCDPVANSTGSPARMSWSGSTSVSADDLVLSASPLPASSSGLMIYSPDEASIALGNGTLCVGSTTLGYVLRLSPETSDGAGLLTHALDLATPPSPDGLITPGSTWYFSCWYRDVGTPPAHFNFADGLEVTFWP